MATAAFNKFNSFVEAMGQKKLNLNADSIKVMLSNVAPVATNSVKANLTDIAAGNGYTAGGSVSAGNSFVQTAGVGKFITGDVTFTASGGAMAAFRYAAFYDDTAVNKDLIGWYDYGSSITLNDGEAFVVDADGVNGLLTVT
jgi:hypothetical protein